MPFDEKTFACFDDFGCQCIKGPVEGFDAQAPWLTLAPWVSLNFCGNNGEEITVGNRSQPPFNFAAIKSFQYGQSNGIGASVEIYDEQGGAFGNFVNKIAKTPEDSFKLYTAIGKWGWTGQGCDALKQKAPITSSAHTFAILSVEMQFSGKGITFKLEMQDLMEPLFETRTPKIPANLTLKEAIRALFKQASPSIPDVQFLKFTNGNFPNICNLGPAGTFNQSTNLQLSEFKFKGDVETKKTNWVSNNQSPLAAVKEWLGNYRTEDDKGIICFWDNVTGTVSQPGLPCKPAIPRLIFLEDPLPKVFNAEDTSCDKSIGTYIVNGGKHTPVIQFDPKIKFNFSAAAHAQTAVSSQDATIAQGEGQPGLNQNSGRGSGSATMVQVTEDMNIMYGPQQAARQGNISQAANERANKTYETVEAELRIQGEPRLDDPFSIKIRTISIVVVNPFHLTGTPDICPYWLNNPPCNPILSNKNWHIRGVSHEIREGSYTTTLQVFLPEPGNQNIKP